MEGESVTVNGESVTVNGESAEVKGERAAGLEVKDESVIIDSQVSGSKLPALSMYKERNKILCDLCGKGYAKSGIARHRKMCINKQANSENEVKEEARESGAVKVVPVIVEEPPQPPARARVPAKPVKLERYRSKAEVVLEKSDDESADEVEGDDPYKTREQSPALSQPKQLTRVDRLRQMLIMEGL